MPNTTRASTRREEEVIPQLAPDPQQQEEQVQVPQQEPQQEIAARIATGTNDPQEISEALQLVRASMNPENVRRNTKAQSTFEKHQGENSRFLYWLWVYEPPKYHHLLAPDMLNEIDDLWRNLTLPENVLQRQSRRTPEEQMIAKKKYFGKLIRSDIINKRLGEPGSAHIHEFRIHSWTKCCCNMY